MVPTFGLKRVPPLSFGPGTLAGLREHLFQFGHQPLLVLGKESFANSYFHQRLTTDLKNSGVHLESVTISGEPSPEAINNIVDRYADTEIDCVIGIGGGSILDGAKAISAMLVEKEDVTHFLEGVGSRSVSGRKLPFIAIPTTSGTGSEATANAVISSVGENGFKKSLRHENYVPELAIVDPNLTLTCPQELTAACGMDSFTQLVEGYLSTNGSPLTDTLALEGIKRVSRSLEKTCSHGELLGPRADMAYGAFLSGIVLANAGLGTVHGFASAIGGYFTVPHGVVCGTLMAATNSLTLRRLRDNHRADIALQKYRNLGRILSDTEAKSDSWYQDFAVAELERLTQALQIPRLGNFGIDETALEKIVASTSNKYNPVMLSKNDLFAILSARL